MNWKHLEGSKPKLMVDLHARNCNESNCGLTMFLFSESFLHLLEKLHDCDGDIAQMREIAEQEFNRHNEAPCKCFPMICCIIKVLKLLGACD